MSNVYDLSKLQPDAFEHLVNALAYRVLGDGHTGFGPGSDGGRDGYFEGEAPYPSSAERWNGTWYLQSKFHASNLSTNPQRWLLKSIKDELDAFSNKKSGRRWPTNWIVATNIDPSGTPETGSFDQARKLVRSSNVKLAERFHIWGGSKILDLLEKYPDVAAHYRHFLTPGHVLNELLQSMGEDRAKIDTLLRYFVIRQFDDQQYTRLEQAGSETDNRPGIHDLFIDLPFTAPEYQIFGEVAKTLMQASSCCHRLNVMQSASDEWRKWRRSPSRARVWFVRGGPGQGKSTTGQYFSQIQRAALILAEPQEVITAPRIKELAHKVRRVAERSGMWPTVPRIPIYVELKNYAQWYGSRGVNQRKGLISYICASVEEQVDETVFVGTLKKALSQRSWFAMFDGLDEVPSDVKDEIAKQVLDFIDEVAAETKADLLSVCTSRRQGYSGQFDKIDGPVIDLLPLTADKALACARPVLQIGRSESDAKKAFAVLQSTMEDTASSVRVLMTTPLQAHIMAIVVRDGSRPPDRRWQLFENFYQVIKRRETNRELPEKKLAALFRGGEKVLREVHNRLGFVLHARAETNQGAQTNLNKHEFRAVALTAVNALSDHDVDDTVETLMDATSNRLVLVNTPDDGEHVRFDVRQLQEFFAAEFLYDAVDVHLLRTRLDLIAGDAHWREVMHFLISALVESSRHTEIDVAASVLDGLNDSGDGPLSRSMCRKLAKGGIIAVQLLKEGVLEQDKRIRHKFRKCLEPLFSSTDTKLLRELRSVAHPNSREWLLDNLVDQIQRMSESESVGAAGLLMEMLVDGDQRVERVTKILASSTLEYAVTAFNIADQCMFGVEQKTFANWVVDLGFSFLLSPDCKAANGSQIETILSLLRRAANSRLATAARNGLDGDLVPLFAKLVSDVNDELRDSAAMRDFGVLRVMYESRVQLSTSEKRQLARSVGESAPKGTGLLEVVQDIYRFMITPSLASARMALKIIADYPSCFEALPTHIKVHFIIGTASYSRFEAKRLFDLDDEPLGHLIEGWKRGEYPFQFHKLVLGSKCTPKQWLECIRHLPKASMMLITNRFWASTGRSDKPRALSSKAGVDLLVDELLRQPQVLISRLVDFVELLDIAPERAAELKVALLSSTETPPNSVQYRVQGLEIPVPPMRIDLPTDQSLLPHVIDAIVKVEEKRVHKNGGRAVRPDGIRLLYSRFDINLSKLIEVFESAQSERSVKAAALALALLHNDADNVLHDRHMELIDCHYDSVEPWFYLACRECAWKIYAHEPEKAFKFVGKFFDVCGRSMYAVRAFEAMLSTWRERSTAPVSSSRLEKYWLSE